MKLDSCIFPVGTKVVISPMIRSSTYPPFSVGFVGSFSGQFRHSPNVVILNVSVTRKGKRGKQRVERSLLTTQVFDVEMERKRIRQDEFKGYPFVHILSTSNTHSSVIDIDPLEFLGWGLAQYTYVADLYKDADIDKRWPRGKHPMNLISSIDNRFYNDPADTLQKYANEEFRTNFTHELRRMEASVVRSVLNYRLKLCLAELKAAAYLLYDNVREKGKLYDKKLITENYNHYKKKYTEFSKFIFSTDMARYESFRAKAKVDYEIVKPTPGLDVVIVRSLNRYFERWVSGHANNTPNFQNAIFKEKKKKEDESESKWTQAPTYFGANERLDLRENDVTEEVRLHD